MKTMRRGAIVCLYGNIIDKIVNEQEKLYSINYYNFPSFFVVGNTSTVYGTFDLALWGYLRGGGNHFLERKLKIIERKKTNCLSN